MNKQISIDRPPSPIDINFNKIFIPKKQQIPY